MLKEIDLSLSLSKHAHKLIFHKQIERLYDLSTRVFHENVPVIVVFEGWDAAGKGTSIRQLTERLDPRGFKVLSTQAPRSHELQKPWLWRFWMQIPRRGQMAIFDRSWYGRVLVERVEGLTPIPDWIRAYEEINEFERVLADDNTVFVKFWLHLSKQEQLRRFIELTQGKTTAWQVTAEDWEHHRKYDEYLAAVRDMLENTSTEAAPWDVVPATDPYYRGFFILATIINRLEAALDEETTAWPSVEELEEAAAARRSKKKMRKATKKQRKQEQKSASASANDDGRNGDDQASQDEPALVEDIDQDVATLSADSQTPDLVG